MTREEVKKNTVLPGKSVLQVFNFITIYVSSVAVEAS